MTMHSKWSLYLVRSKGSDRLLRLACRLPPRLPSQSPSDHSLFECSQDIRIALMSSRVRLPFYFMRTTKKHSPFDECFAIWCGRRDSNPHGRPHGPEPCASANSATTAYLIVPLSCGTIIIIQHLFINCNENFMIFLNFSF